MPAGPNPHSNIYRTNFSKSTHQKQWGYDHQTIVLTLRQSKWSLNSIAMRWNIANNPLQQARNVTVEDRPGLISWISAVSMLHTQGYTCVNNAANDMEFIRCVVQQGNSELVQITSVEFRGSHGRSKWETKDTLQYPNHIMFKTRIPYTSWKQFSIDLDKEIATHYSCMPLMRLCGRRAFTLGRHQAFYNVLAYYNKHLFHPMLIDAQIFVHRMFETGQSEGKWVVHPSFIHLKFSPALCFRCSGINPIIDTQYLCFVMAPDRETLLHFPRPTIGRSIGYKNDSAVLPCYRLDFLLEDTLNLPATLPAQTPAVVPMHPQPENSNAGTVPRVRASQPVMPVDVGTYGPSAVSVDPSSMPSAYTGGSVGYARSAGYSPVAPAAPSMALPPSRPVLPVGYAAPLSSASGNSGPETFAYPAAAVQMTPIPVAMTALPSGGAPATALATTVSPTYAQLGSNADQKNP
jgi:hypothetical protein